MNIDKVLELGDKHVLGLKKSKEMNKKKLYVAKLSFLAGFTEALDLSKEDAKILVDELKNRIKRH